ncbi:ABC transporter substrate-binding protein [Streptomyces sp. DSM 44915]|uniref:ABC transporter substrate-binding protein n=1 Tax=Streptomyces chisholmiae TaxID=3075540 RepID=A0ABU2JYC8_9ACTN|nr:ABC transporter substrate-binding protein [Streptomyces sp. DSM 44915]MDT0269739.1 ABC transporter substrate-binding protein [Streptomyces sp. DSM 44915]
MTGRRPARRRTRAGALAGALAGLLVLTTAACSDYGGDLSGANVSGSGDGDTLVVSETAGVPSSFLAYGVAQGYFADEGVDLRVSPSSGGASVIPALLSGDIDVAGSNVVSAMIAMGRRMPIQMVAAGTSTAEDPADDFASLVVPEDSPITEPADLDGTRIAVNSLQNINDVVVNSVLSEAGLTNDDIRFVEMPLPDIPAAIQRGDVDAGVLIEPFASIGRSQGLRVLASPYVNTRPGLQIGTYLMTSERVADDPELVAAFRAGVERTARSVAEDPDAFRAALPEISDLSPELAGQMNLPVWRGGNDRESIETIHAVMREIGLTEADLDYERSVAD